MNFLRECSASCVKSAGRWILVAGIRPKALCATWKRSAHRKISTQRRYRLEEVIYERFKGNNPQMRCTGNGLLGRSAFTSRMRHARRDAGRSEGHAPGCRCRMARYRKKDECMSINFTYWQDSDGLWVGFWNDYPDYVTQGHDFAEL